MAGTSWPALAAGARARASDVELKLDWIEGDIVPMSGGSTTDAAYDLGTTAARWRSAYFSTRVNTPAIGLSNTSFMTFDATGTITASIALKAASGVAVNEFSIDGTLAGNSDLAVPTEKAVKTYVDGQISHGIFVSAILASSTTLGPSVLRQKIQFTEQLDPNSEFSTSTFKPNSAGTYEVTFAGAAQMSGVGEGAIYAILYKNGSATVARPNYVNNLGATIFLSHVLSLTSTDTIEVYTNNIGTSSTLYVNWPVYGDTVTSLTDIPATFLQIRRVG